MKQIPVSFLSDKLRLVGYCYVPDDNKIYPAVILCHPHPLYGGSMSIPIIRNMGEAIVSRNIIAFMFNFRGVGKSEGIYGGGIAEREDAFSALNWLITQTYIDKTRIGIAGYSFGGGVAAPVACQDKRIKAFTLISPVLDKASIQMLSNCTKPKLFVIGEDDDIINPEEIESVYKISPEPKKFKRLSKADHFYSGCAMEMIESVANFFAEVFISNKFD